MKKKEMTAKEYKKEYIKNLSPEELNDYQETKDKLDFGLSVILMRDKVGWTQEQLAQSTGVPLAMIKSIEDGEVTPDYYSLRKLNLRFEIKQAVTG